MLIIIGFIGNPLQFQSKNPSSRNFQLSHNIAVTSLGLAVIMETGDTCEVFIALYTTVNNFLSIIIYIGLFKSLIIQYIEIITVPSGPVKACNGIALLYY
jgi:uncharacterized Tic20 family protein